MVIDISQIITNDGAVRQIDGVTESDGVLFNGQDIRFSAPISVRGEIKNVSGVLCLELDCSAEFDTQCARCTDDIHETLNFHVSERLAKEASDDDIIVIGSHEFDLDETVMKSFCSELPINYVCSEDCKGLCHVCGCNLNREQCDCEDDYIDPRLAALKDFL